MEITNRSSRYNEQMRLAICYNPRPEKLDRNDPALEKFIEGDEWKTIRAIGQAVRANGHLVKYIPVNKRLYSNLSRHKSNIDLILNLAEGFSGIPDREAHLPALAEILGIPHTGPGILSAALILNKARAKEIWRSNGVATADWQLIKSSHFTLSPLLKFPLIVKPNADGSGIGIHNSSIVHSLPALKKSVTQILLNYHQPALVETFLPGREFTVSIVGNGHALTVLPLIEINFASLPKGAAPIDSYEAKFIYGATGVVPMDSTEICPAILTPALQQRIIKLAKKAYTTIGCQDFGRLDIRLDQNEVPYVLEINHPPGLMSDPDESSFFTISARAHGWNLQTLIGQIIKAAIKRLELKPQTSTPQA